jgi:transglutaminase superfamily protein
VTVTLHVEQTRERLLALSAVLILPLALRVLSLSRTLALCDRWPVMTSSQASPYGLSDRTERWLAHGRGPWTSSCLTRSIVLYTLLRSHGYAPCLHIGVVGAPARFLAHAWVTLQGHPVGERTMTVASYRELVVHSA